MLTSHRKMCEQDYDWFLPLCASCFSFCCPFRHTVCTEVISDRVMLENLSQMAELKFLVVVFVSSDNVSPFIAVSV